MGIQTVVEIAVPVAAVMADALRCLNKREDPEIGDLASMMQSALEILSSPPSRSQSGSESGDLKAVAFWEAQTLVG